MGDFVDVLNSNNIRLSEAGCPAWPRAPERLLPAAIDLERALLGAILLDPPQLLAVVEVLPPGQPWFYDEAHRLVYDAMLTLFERRDPVDLQTVTDVLYRRGHLEKVGGSVYLAGLMGRSRHHRQRGAPRPAGAGKNALSQPDQHRHRAAGQRLRAG
jgi:DnaB-like helicase N terminal domain